ncbi:hypothetical protein BC832DRAFT_591425 [Gaertneriomyces semiglobifer]|nr:hypothetical protein BC832DRAFT_591425 [Gaertneriomyces semiglobifer]
MADTSPLQRPPVQNEIWIRYSDALDAIPLILSSPSLRIHDLKRLALALRKDVEPQPNPCFIRIWTRNGEKLTPGKSISEVENGRSDDDYLIVEWGEAVGSDVFAVKAERTSDSGWGSEGFRGRRRTIKVKQDPFEEEGNDELVSFCSQRSSSSKFVPSQTSGAEPSANTNERVVSLISDDETEVMTHDAGVDPGPERFAVEYSPAPSATSVQDPLLDTISSEEDDPLDTEYTMRHSRRTLQPWPRTPRACSASAAAPSVAAGTPPTISARSLFSFVCSNYLTCKSWSFTRHLSELATARYVCTQCGRCQGSSSRGLLCRICGVMCNQSSGENNRSYVRHAWINHKEYMTGIKRLMEPAGVPTEAVNQDGSPNQERLNVATEDSTTSLTPSFGAERRTSHEDPVAMTARPEPSAAPPVTDPVDTEHVHHSATTNCEPRKSFEKVQMPDVLSREEPSNVECSGSGRNEQLSRVNMPTSVENPVDPMNESHESSQKSVDTERSHQQSGDQESVASFKEVIARHEQTDDDMDGLTLPRKRRRIIIE